MPNEFFGKHRYLITPVQYLENLYKKRYDFTYVITPDGREYYRGRNGEEFTWAELNKLLPTPASLLFKKQLDSRTSIFSDL